MGKVTCWEILLRTSPFLENHGKETYSIQFSSLGRKQQKKLDWLLHMNKEISEEEQRLIETDLRLLLADHPPQYLLGYADSCSHRLKVIEATLIPRPETEELVEWRLDETPGIPLEVIDIRTGTGAIAISLKTARKNWHVSAVDLSEGALEVAEEDTQKEGTKISFYHGDTLGPVMDQRFDVIISNPPYISRNEWELMDENVRSFEPRVALFAENDGLAVYEKIAVEAPSVLKSNGEIFLEIGFRQDEAVKKKFQQAFPDKKVAVKKDLFGNRRMIQVYG